MKNSMKMLGQIKTKIITILLSFILIIGINQVFGGGGREHIYVNYDNNVIEFDGTYFYEDYEIKSIEFEYFSDTDEGGSTVSLKHGDTLIAVENLNKDKIIFDNINFFIKADSVDSMTVEFKNPLIGYFKLKNIEVENIRTGEDIEVRINDKLYVDLNLSTLSSEKNVEAGEKNVVAFDFEIHSDKNHSEPVLTHLELSNIIDNDDFNNSTVTDISIWKKDGVNETLIANEKGSINNGTINFSNINSEMINNHGRYVVTLSFDENVLKPLEIKLKLVWLSIAKDKKDAENSVFFAGEYNITPSTLLSNRTININSLEIKDYSVELTSNPSAQKDIFGQAKIKVEIGEIIKFKSFSREPITEWKWVYDKTKMKCGDEVSKLNIKKIKCKIISTGNSSIELENYKKGHLEPKIFRSNSILVKSKKVKHNTKVSRGSYLSVKKIVNPGDKNIVALDFEIENNNNFPIYFRGFSLSSIYESGFNPETISSAKLFKKEGVHEKVILDKLSFKNKFGGALVFDTAVLERIESKSKGRFIFTVSINDNANDSKLKLKVSDLNLRPIVRKDSKYFGLRLQTNDLISNRVIEIKELEQIENPPKITSVKWGKMKGNNKSLIVKFDKVSDKYYFGATHNNGKNVASTNIKNKKIKLNYDFIFGSNFKDKKYHKITIGICKIGELGFIEKNCINIKKHKYIVKYGSNNDVQIVMPIAGYEDQIITTERKSNFKDKGLDTLEGQSANYLFEEGIIGGYSDATFRGDNLVNRAEASKFLVLAKFGKYFNTSYYTGELNYQTKLWDVKQDEWYAPFVNKAEFHNIVKGYSDGSFKPAAGVRRGEFLKMLTKTFNLNENLSHDFIDVDQDWIIKYAGIVGRYNLFPNIGNKLNPGDFMTRDEVAVAIYQLKTK